MSEFNALSNAEEYPYQPSNFQASFCLFEEQSQSNSLFQELLRSPRLQSHPSVDKLMDVELLPRWSIDQCWNHDQNGQIQQQESRISQRTETQEKPQEKKVDKHNLCILLVRSIRRIIKRQLKMKKDLSQIEKNYYQFMMKILKTTRKSLIQCIITPPEKQGDPLLLNENIQALKCGKDQQPAQIIKAGKEYLRKLVCSKEIHSQRINEQKKTQFLIYAQRMINEIRCNKMRGKDIKGRR